MFAAAAATLAKVDGREGQAVENWRRWGQIEGLERGRIVRTYGRVDAEFNQSECVRVAPNAPRTNGMMEKRVIRADNVRALPRRRPPSFC